MINFGRMNNRVTFQQLTGIRNDYNEVQQEYVDVCKRMVRVINNNSKQNEDKEASRVKTISIRMRYDTLIHEGLFVLFRNELFRVDTVTDYDYGMRELVLECTFVTRVEPTLPPEGE